MHRNLLTFPVEIQRTVSAAEPEEKTQASVEFHAGYTPRRARYTRQRASEQDIPLARSPAHLAPAFIIVTRKNTYYFICVYLCVFVCFCFILHMCCIIVSVVEWTRWDRSLILRTYLPSVL